MPYFEVQTSRSLSREKKNELMHCLGKTIELVPGKSESWVMVHIEDDSYVSFAGNDDAPAAAIVVKTFGELEAKYYDILTKAICNDAGTILEVDPKRLYVIYQPIDHWGWDSGNF